MATRHTIRRAFTGDRGPPSERGVLHPAAEKLGPKMSRLPNGNLLCKDVPIARVGWMMYGPNETPVKVGGNGVAYVERTEDELFNFDTIASFTGSAITDGHPPEDVTVANWDKYSRGFATNVRRGTGDEEDVLLADLIITDSALIADVLAGKREVSCGYDADYTQTGPGQGKQTKIQGNHIATVDRGRCGPRCAIGDHATLLPLHETENIMPERTPIKTKRVALIAAARQKVLDAETELEQATNDAEAGEEDGHTHIHIHAGADGAAKKKKKADPDDKEGDDADGALDKRMEAMETGMAALSDQMKGLANAIRAKSTADEETPEAKAAREEAEAAVAKASKQRATIDAATDSKALEASYGKVLAQAEVLVPGFRMPTFDAAATRATTIDAMCGARRRCLDLVFATKDGAAMLTTLNGDVEPLPFADNGDCAAVAVMFNAAAGAKAAANNRAATGDSSQLPKDKKDEGTGRMTIADVNKANEAWWSQQQAKA